MRAVIIVPWRGGDARREESWQFTRRWWERFGYPIYEVEHEGDEPFSRAWCINEGARRAWPWDVALIIDADVVADTDEQPFRAVVTAWETGAYTIAHTVGRDLNDTGTKWLLDGGKFDWHRQTDGVRPGCTSRINAIRADLFCELGGFDERFIGWGHEDVAFEHAAQIAAGPFARIEGSTWHLYHEPMLARSRETLNWQNGKRLANRYLAVKDWNGLGPILDERKDTERFEAPDAGAKLKDVEVELVVLTCGRKEYLQETLASADANLVGSISARTMFDDSADPQFGAWLDGEYGHSWKIVHHDKNLGFTGANGSARKHLVDAGGPEYVFWLEEDFTFRQPVQLDDLANALDAPGLAQVALLRAPYYQREFEAGSIPNEHPESYRQDRFRGVPILRHQRFYTTNPNLSKREMIGKYPWLTGSHSESRYGKGLVADGYDFAFLGHGETWVDHIGKVRKGSGY